MVVKTQWMLNQQEIAMEMDVIQHVRRNNNNSWFDELSFQKDSSFDNFDFCPKDYIRNYKILIFSIPIKK